MSENESRDEAMPFDDAARNDAVPLRRVPQWLQVHRFPAWWFELLLIVAFDIAYEHVRNMVKLQPIAAIDHGLAVLHFSDWFDLDLERWANQLLVHHHWLAVIANYDYATLHLPLTAGVLVWVFWRHRDRYLPIRNVLLLTTVIGLIGFWIYPMAPPRLLPGHNFVDTVVWLKTWGSWADPKVADATNQFAAMPSMHCAWALWCGLCLFFLARTRAVRAFGLLYPMWTVFVVVGTANHFLLDAIAGIACVAVSVGLMWRIYGQHPWARRSTATLPLRSETGGPDRVAA